MSRPKPPPPLDQPPSDLPWLAAGLAGAAALACMFVGGTWQSTSAPLPFVWLDVALVQFVSAAPLAVFLAAIVRRRTSPAACLSIAVVAAALSLLLVFLAGPATHSLAAFAQRAAIANGLALAAALCLLGARPSPAQPAAGLLAMAAAIVVFVPPIYIHARAKSDLSRLGELLDQTRLGEAQDLAHALSRMDPALQFDGRPIGEVARRLDQVVDEIAARALSPLPTDVSHEQLLARAQELAILNFTDEALVVIDAADELHESAAAANLRGTIHETRGQWREGLAAFQRARQLSLEQPQSPQPTGLIQAVTGIAFCQRKLGDKRAAALAYDKLLGLAPTADTHFLLAQFYDDTQQATRADRHARQAMSLDPDRYGQRGTQLLDKLRTTQFSCWAIGSSP